MFGAGGFRIGGRAGTLSSSWCWNRATRALTAYWRGRPFFNIYVKAPETDARPGHLNHSYFGGRVQWQLDSPWRRNG